MRRGLFATLQRRSGEVKRADQLVGVEGRQHDVALAKHVQLDTHAHIQLISPQQQANADTTHTRTHQPTNTHTYMCVCLHNIYIHTHLHGISSTSQLLGAQIVVQNCIHVNE